jgi:hypothetical protein
VAALAVLAGCSLTVNLPGATTAGTSSAPAPTSSPVASPTSASPTGTVTSTPTPTPTATVPTADGAIDVDAFESAHFASPTGRIWCALYDDWTLCHFPFGMDYSAVPKTSTVCPGEHLDVTGVSVQEEADYFCSGGAEALPQTNGEYVDWWKPTGFPSVKYQGFKLAVLPYGEKLRKGDFLCESEKSGVTCVNLASGRGFTVAKRGVTFLKA